MYTGLFKKTALLVVLGILIFVISLVNLLGENEIINPTPMDPDSIERGQDVFINFCSGCHGLRADGKGPQSYYLDPKPQNLRNPQFIKHLLDERIFYSISGGVRGTSMPAFELMLYEDQRWDAVNYVRSLTADDDINISNALFHISVTKDVINPVKSGVEVLKKGKMDYMYHCANCHGKKADGAGDTSINLIPAPRNLVSIKSWGEKPFVYYMSDHWIFDSIANGVPGTSMAPWGGALKTDGLWSVVVYLRNEASIEMKRIETTGILGGE